MYNIFLNIHGERTLSLSKESKHQQDGLYVQIPLLPDNGLSPFALFLSKNKILITWTQQALFYQSRDSLIHLGKIHCCLKKDKKKEKKKEKRKRRSIILSFCYLAQTINFFFFLNQTHSRRGKMVLLQWHNNFSQPMLRVMLHT